MAGCGSLLRYEILGHFSEIFLTLSVNKASPLTKFKNRCKVFKFRGGAMTFFVDGSQTLNHKWLIRQITSYVEPATFVMSFSSITEAFLVIYLKLWQYLYGNKVQHILNRHNYISVRTLAECILYVVVKLNPARETRFEKPLEWPPAADENSQILNMDWVYHRDNVKCNFFVLHNEK